MIHQVKPAKVYSRNEIPVDPSEATTSFKLKEWQYIDYIIDKIVSNDAVSIDIFIGDNCTEALEPISFLASKNGGPYALETILACCVMAPTESTYKRNGVISCNRVVV